MSVAANETRSLWGHLRERNTEGLAGGKPQSTSSWAINCFERERNTVV